MDKSKCKKIFDRLVSNGFSENGAFAIIGNLQAESALCSNNLQQNGNKKLGLSDKEFTEQLESGKYTQHQFVHDGYGYGLAQWTYFTRKNALYFFAKTQGKKISDVELQVDFIAKEIKGYGQALTGLYTDIPIRELSDLVLTVYEKPADQSEAMKKKRYGYAMEAYDIIKGKKVITGEAEDERLAQVVERVIDGVYGNYPLRKKLLEAEGYDYREVQDEVNKELKRRKENG